MSLIPLVENDSANEAQTAILAQMPPLNLFKGLLHSPGLTTPVAQLGGNILYKTKIEARLREAVILRVAHLSGCAYEIAHHEGIGRDVGLSDGDLAALASGNFGKLDPSIGLVARWADETKASGRASPQLVAAAIEALGPEQTVELAVIVGYYTMLAQCLQSFEIPLEGVPVIDIDARPAALDAP